MLLKLLRSKSAQGETAMDGFDLHAFTDEAPMLCMLGSLVATKKSDALAYARGQVEDLVTAKDACHLQVVKGAEDRWYYEIHEGGLGRALLPWALDQLTRNPKAKLELPLAGNRLATVSTYEDEVVTVISSREDAHGGLSVQELEGFQLGEMLPSFYGTAAMQRNMAVSAFCMSLVFLLVSGLFAFLKSNAINPKEFTEAYSSANPGNRTEMINLPSFQLDIAAKSLSAGSGYLSYLKYAAGRWTWAQASSEDDLKELRAIEPDIEAKQ
ncbi:hypothetical protein [Acidovorax sp. sic0104]|uniref:hypothetical protein n=1 Tax=Acidovorax sp. sic0104 TaxID=2854784 RepID=UPI001C45661F|nr:hypothetical protein [Acidovorax sp. sic0104]MBV7542134.1 hypothetical protein [Acidovorax sp. sic0104]